MAHPILRTALLALPVILSAHPACAVWVQCQATGSSAQGPMAFYATIVDVGAVPPARLSALQQRLTTYATKYEASLTAVRSQCFSSDDQQVAASRYSRVLDAGYRRLGWEHVVVVQPSDWLTGAEIVNDPTMP